MADIKTISKDEVAKHRQKDDLWLVIHHNGYDVSKYLEDHPGGAYALLEVAGQDSTAAFEDVGHSADARETMESFLIGKLEGAPEEDDYQASKLPIPKPNIKPGDNDFHSESPVLAIGRTILKVAVAGVTVYLAYEASARSPVVSWIAHHEGGFWKGALLSTMATLSVVTGAGLYFEQAMNAQSRTPYSYPAHFKPSIHIAKKPITKVKGWLKPEEYQKLPLAQKDKLSSNAFRFVFKLPNDDTILGLPIGQHIGIRADIEGKTVSRSYTPVSNNSDPGILKLVIKCYLDGLLTGKYLQNLQVGDLVEIRGPKGAMRYRKGMVAGGTGITPMFQASHLLIRAICEDPTDTTHVSLLYGNNSEADILLRQELDEFQRRYPENLNVTHVLSHPSESWNGAKGFVSKDMLEEKFPQPKKESKALLCEPPKLVDAMKKSLIDLGWNEPRAVSYLPDQVFCF
ncbi:cytochrome b5 reductase-like protein [Mollisia scopiformis]|uniref:Cytochrome b5 reductase-like protein n=1 Tax=Mollisia scopiformis TaxID=149040 RepID=A0A132B8T7_MOLSC|nr:cytochrome b5 reductase-like protein [Mollisia scopiformis]KUJ08822.1 cytochrome b5 reductase-like protein [Mollisia scopiformis]